MAEFEVQIKEENLVFRKSPVLTDKVMHYCPGCSHGTVHNLVAEVIEDLGIQDKTIGVSPVGCSVFAYNYLHIDWSQAAHGRACAVATAINARRLFNAVLGTAKKRVRAMKSTDVVQEKANFSVFSS